MQTFNIREGKKKQKKRRREIQNSRNRKPRQIKTSSLYMILNYVTECAGAGEQKEMEVEIFFLLNKILPGFSFQSLKPKPPHLFVPSFFVFFEFGSMRFSSDFAFLSRVLPASFRSSVSLLFSSSKSGFAIPSFSSRSLRTYSKISIASSTLKKIHKRFVNN